MRILVTGGAGFIGSAFLQQLVPQRVQDNFLNIDRLGYASNLGNLSAIETAPNYQFQRVDLCDADATLSCVRAFEPDLVVHFAAESHVDRSISGPRAFVDANVNGTLNLLEACRTTWGGDFTGKRFHHISTDEVFGALGREGVFTEATPYDPKSPYSASKACSDHLVRAYGHTYGFPFVITNCSNNYGPRQFPEKLIPLMILNCLEGKPLPVYGEGTQIRDWLYVDDHVRAIELVATNGRLGETYLIGGGHEVANLAIVHAICEEVATQLGKDPAQLQNLIEYVTDRPGHDFRYAIDATKIREELGWIPQESFESGLRKTVAWYLAEQDWVAQVRSGEYRAWIDQHYGKEQR